MGRSHWMAGASHTVVLVAARTLLETCRRRATQMTTQRFAPTAAGQLSDSGRRLSQKPRPMTDDEIAREMMREFDKKWMAARAWYTAGRTADWQCERCGATSNNMPDRCPAPLDDQCPGFVRLEEVHREFLGAWRSLVNG